MKLSLNQVTGRTLFASFALVTTLLFSSCAKEDAGLSVSLSYSLSGNASGGQAVPASSNSNGSGTMTGTYSSSTKVMSYTTTWAGLTGTPLTGGLYAGTVGEIGTSITVWSLGSGLTASGNFSTSTTLTADQEIQLLAGKCYYIMGTTANASGEIRGQVTATAK